MSKMPECKVCGDYIHHGFVICDKCFPQKGKKMYIQIIDKLNTVHDIINHNFATPNTIEGRRAMNAKNILFDAIHRLNEMERNMNKECQCKQCAGRDEY